MFGCRLRAICITLLLVVLLLAAAACSEKKANDLAFNVDFACESDRELADRLELRLVRDGCQGEETVYEASLGKGAVAPAGNGIAPGSYGLSATALFEGAMLAHSCLEVTLPAQEPPMILLRSPDCDAPVVDDDSGVIGDTDAAGPDQVVPDASAEDMDARSDAAGGDAEPADGNLSQDDAAAGPDADARALDAEVDAAPLPCASDCKDSFPCTEDRCVNGECVHDPFTGTRECDNIACTQNDKCESGTCKSGTPNNGMCPNTDTNVCTLEICDVTRGCIRQNAPSTTACVDPIACTINDRCNNGICRSGTDNCTNGQICSAAGSCVATSCSTNCDDGDPCTDDFCESAMCKHTRRVGALNRCSDGKTCTANDACGASANQCTGEDICPNGASCDGSLCNCDDSNQTLCDDTSVTPTVQVCANTTSDPKFCGSCSRKCASGASCENSACKPSGAASDCTAYRYSGHDYLVCKGGQSGVSWTAARDQCRNWGLGLAIIESPEENTFLKDNSASQQHWIGANDRGDNGSGQNNSRNACIKNAEEGTWYWARPSSTGNNNADDNFRKFCTMEYANNAWSCKAEGGTAYQNWASPQPDNAGCSNCGCQIIFCNSCNDGEDCGSLLADGTWNDAPCNANMGFICESP